MLLQTCQSVLCVLLLRNYRLNEIVWCSQLEADDTWLCCASKGVLMQRPPALGPQAGAKQLSFPSSFTHLWFSYCVPGPEAGCKQRRHRPCLQGAYQLMRASKEDGMNVQENSTCNDMRKTFWLKADGRLLGRGVTIQKDFLSW